MMKNATAPETVVVIATVIATLAVLDNYMKTRQRTRTETLDDFSSNVEQVLADDIAFMIEGGIDTSLVNPRYDRQLYSDLQYAADEDFLADMYLRQNAYHERDVAALDENMYMHVPVTVQSDKRDPFYVAYNDNPYAKTFSGPGDTVGSLMSYEYIDTRLGLPVDLNIGAFDPVFPTDTNVPFRSYDT